MKKAIFMILIWSVMCINVYAQTHEVQAKYEKDYNVEIATVTINNDTKTLNIDDYLLEVSTTQKSIDVVVIKVEDEGNDYVKKFTKSALNYYIGFYKDNKKINQSNVTLKIKNSNKVLNVYDNLGNIINSSNENINLNNNDYFIAISDKINNDTEDYKIVDVNSLAKDIEKVGDDSTISVYSYKNVLIENSKPLGTGYRVVINNLDAVKEYKIVVKGDTTGDAKINLNDITRLYHYYKKIEQMDELFVLAGDVAKNDIINLNDITKIYHYYKKIIASL